jgi:hypothetical protein
VEEETPLDILAVNAATRSCVMQLSTRKPATRSRGWRPLSDQEVGRPHFRFKNPYVEGQLEFLVQAVYDYLETALNTQMVSQVAFSIQKGGPYTPTGGTVFNKAFIHTNLLQAGILAAPQKQLVKGIAIVVRSDVYPSDLNLLQYTCQCNFTVGDGEKSYHRGLVAESPGGVGPQGSSTQTSVGLWSNGMPYTKNVNILAIDDNDGVGIEEGQNLGFTVDPSQIQGGASTLANSPNGTGWKIWIKLLGINARGVQ